MPDGGTVSLSIAGEIVERHPGVLVGGFLASGLRAATAVVAARPRPDDTAQALVSQDVTIELVADHPLVRDWRAAVAACGLKPSTYKSGPEQLARRTLKGDTGTGPPLVDLCHDVATRHLAALAGHDVAHLPVPHVDLRLADPATDTFVPIGGREGDLPLTARVAVFVAGGTVLSWAHNCRDSRVTGLRVDTDAGLFLGHAVTARQHHALRTALDELHGLLAAAGARVSRVVYADGDAPGATFAGE